MNNKVTAIIVVILVAIVGVGAAVAMMGGEDQSVVTYDANGGSSSEGTQISSLGELAPSCLYTKEDRVFCYWNTQADGQGTVYNPLSPNDVEKFKDAGVTKLYAIWGYKLTVNISYMSNVASHLLSDPLTYGVLFDSGAVTVLSPGTCVGIPDSDGHATIAFFDPTDKGLVWTYDAEHTTFSADLDNGANKVSVKVTGLNVLNPSCTDKGCAFSFDLNTEATINLSTSVLKN